MDVTLLTAARTGALQDSGAWTSQGLVAGSRARIADGDGTCNAIAFLNPDADGQAERLDRERGEGSVRGPLHGVPILVKDNIATGDAMMTTAGSLALDGVRAPADAHVVRRLRDAGLVLLGKTNLSEWANFRSSRSVTGWSSRGGQVRNARFRDRSPGGSSSGSGTAVARGFTALAIGTETDGSVVVPAAMNGIVGIKPTVGLVSRTGVIPISASQDTAGPMARTVEDAALLLGAIAGSDPDDPATEHADDHAGDFTSFLDADALRGARIGVVRSYCGWHEAVDAVFAAALARMADAGAFIVEDVRLPGRDVIRPHEIVVMCAEFRTGLDHYLAQLAGHGVEAPVRSLADVIAFNEANATRTMPWFGQDLMTLSQASGGATGSRYLDARAECLRLAREDGIDRALETLRLDALVAPTAPAPWAIDLANGDHRLGGSSTPAAVAGYPSVTVPMGDLAGLPLGLSMFAGAWQEGRLIGLAHAFEKLGAARHASTEPATVSRNWLA